MYIDIEIYIYRYLLSLIFNYVYRSVRRHAQINFHLALFLINLTRVKTQNKKKIREKRSYKCAQWEKISIYICAYKAYWQFLRLSISYSISCVENQMKIGFFLNGWQYAQAEITFLIPCRHCEAYNGYIVPMKVVHLHMSWKAIYRY